MFLSLNNLKNEIYVHGLNKSDLFDSLDQIHDLFRVKVGR